MKLQKNPNVTVRMRGVMEKCTYCVQRIEEAKIAAKVRAGASDKTLIPRDSFTSACAQACPTEAIVFGDVKDPESRVSKMKMQDRNYRLLEYLNVKHAHQLPGADSEPKSENARRPSRSAWRVWIIMARPTPSLRTRRRANTISTSTSTTRQRRRRPRTIIAIMITPRPPHRRRPQPHRSINIDEGLQIADFRFQIAG